MRPAEWKYFQTSWNRRGRLNSSPYGIPRGEKKKRGGGGGGGGGGWGGGGVGGGGGGGGGGFGMEKKPFSSLAPSGSTGRRTLFIFF